MENLLDDAEGNEFEIETEDSRGVRPGLPGERDTSARPDGGLDRRTLLIATLRRTGQVVAGATIVGEGLATAIQSIRVDQLNKQVESLKGEARADLEARAQVRTNAAYAYFKQVVAPMYAAMEYKTTEDDDPQSAAREERTLTTARQIEASPLMRNDPVAAFLYVCNQRAIEYRAQYNDPSLSPFEADYIEAIGLCGVNLGSVSTHTDELAILKRAHGALTCLATSVDDPTDPALVRPLATSYAIRSGASPEETTSLQEGDAEVAAQNDGVANPLIYFALDTFTSPLSNLYSGIFKPGQK